MATRRTTLKPDPRGDYPSRSQQLRDQPPPHGLNALWSNLVNTLSRLCFFVVSLSVGVLPSPAQAEAFDAEASVDRLQPRGHILAEKVLCRQPGRYIGWPSIVLTDKGEMLVVFSGDRDWHVCPWGKVQCVRSADGGRTWSAAETIIDTPIDDRDPSIIQLPDGSLGVSTVASLAFDNPEVGRYKPYQEYAASLGDTKQELKGNWFYRSTDHGLTWEAAGRPPVSTPHGPAVLSDGRLLIVRNPVVESKDYGKTWTKIASIEKDAETWKSRYAFLSEQHAVEASDGRLVALSRYADGKDIDLRQAVSFDGGKTWSRPRPTGMQGYPAHLLKLDNGWLLASYGRRTAPMGQRACISKDHGETWLVDEEITLSNAVLQGRGDLGYPASVQLPDGTIWTVYYQVEKESHGEFPSLMATHWRLRGE